MSITSLADTTRLFWATEFKSLLASRLRRRSKITVYCDSAAAEAIAWNIPGGLLSLLDCVVGGGGGSSGSSGGGWREEGRSEGWNAVYNVKCLEMEVDRLDSCGDRVPYVPKLVPPG